MIYYLVFKRFSDLLIFWINEYDAFFVDFYLPSFNNVDDLIEFIKNRKDYNTEFIEKSIEMLENSKKFGELTIINSKNDRVSVALTISEIEKDVLFRLKYL